MFWTYLWFHESRNFSFEILLHLDLTFRNNIYFPYWYCHWNKYTWYYRQTDKEGRYHARRLSFHSRTTLWLYFKMGWYAIINKGVAANGSAFIIAYLMLYNQRDKRVSIQKLKLFSCTHAAKVLYFSVRKATKRKVKRWTIALRFISRLIIR